MDDVCTKSRKEEYDGQVLADLLMSAHRHESREQIEAVLSNIKANRKILKDGKFRNTMEEAHVSPTILDLFHELS